MAQLQIEEFRETGRFGAPVPMYPPAASVQQVAIGASSVVAPNAFASETHYVRLTTDVACWIAVGEAPTAAVVAAGGSGASTHLTTLNYPYDIAVQPGHKLAVIAG
jgi:hypothetical protein